MLRKIRRSKVLILGVFIYLIFQISLVFLSKNTKTLALEVEEFKATMKTKGIIVREEYLITSQDNGILDLKFKDGDKVRKNETIAYIKKDKKVDKIDKKINKANEDIKNITKSVSESSNEIAKEIEENKLKNKKEEKKILQSEKEKSTSYVSTEVSGVISYKFDNMENKYTLDELKKITSNDIEKEENNYTQVKDNSTIKKGEPIARIINNYESYIVTCISKDESKNFVKGETLKIVLNKEEIDAKVDQIEKNGSNVTIIFKITNQNVGIYDTRVEEFDIIYKQIEGLKIPKSSVKVVNGKKGVYVVNEQTQDIEFIELEGIEHEDKEFVYLDYYKNNIDGSKTVNLYDEIILRPNAINKNIKMK
ncbi:hypothetical protein NWE74_08405 [Romboutsia lituseburensis]|nr:hypothetical protein [Romboutsia lituseburensis]